MAKASPKRTRCPRGCRSSSARPWVTAERATRSRKLASAVTSRKIGGAAVFKIRTVGSNFCPKLSAKRLRKRLSVGCARLRAATRRSCAGASAAMSHPIAASSGIFGRTNTGVQSVVMCYFAAIPDNSAASIEAFVRVNVKTGTTLLTDGHRSYPGLIDYRHDPRTVGKMAGHLVLPWIHRVFALMKRWGLGTYHGLRRKPIDTYLNEFVFRYNRRFYRHVSFETMLVLASHHETDELLGYRRARQSPQRRADSPTPAAAP